MYSQFDLQGEDTRLGSMLVGLGWLAPLTVGLFMPPVLVTRPLSLRTRLPAVMAVIIASTHCAGPRRDGQAELSWVAG